MPMCIEQVDAVRQDAYTIELFRDHHGNPRGRVVPPTRGPAQHSRQVSSEFSPGQAIEIAIRLARQAHAEVVIWDPEGLWPAEWGELTRA
jgi:hypothetical protein